MDCILSVGSTVYTPQSVIVSFPNPTNCTTPIEWDTINFTLPTGITAVATSDPRQWRFVANSSVIPGTYGGS